MALGDTVSGAIDPSHDQDWYAVDLPAGTTVQIDVDVVEIGSSLDPVLYIYVVDTLNRLVERRFNDESKPWSPLYWLTIPATGRYYLRMLDWEGRGGANRYYTIKIVSIAPPPPGPGEPLTISARGLSGPYGMTAGDNGDIYVADAGTSSIRRVNAAGTSSTYVAGVANPWDVAFDGAGNLLIASPSAGVTRVSPPPSMRRTVFLSDFTAVSLAVDVAGDVWVGGSSSEGLEIRHYTTGGRLVEKIPFLRQEGGGLVASGMAISPAGDVYVHNAYNGIYRVTGGLPTRVATTPIGCLWDLAFDVDGYLYVTSCMGQVLLYDPAFQPVAMPFARTNGGPIVFGRDSSGAMLARLFAASGNYEGAIPIYPEFAGTLAEFNPAAVRAPGGRPMLRITTEALRPGFVGVPYADTLHVATAPGPVTWRVTEGALPAGVSLDSTKGVLSGRPGRADTSAFVVRASSGGRFGMGGFTLAISSVPVTAQAAADALLGKTGTVTLEAEQLLDRMGNGNGRLDIADFRAYLQSLGALAPRPQGAKP